MEGMAYRYGCRREVVMVVVAEVGTLVRRVYIYNGNQASRGLHNKISLYIAFLYS